MKKILVSIALLAMGKPMFRIASIIIALVLFHTQAYSENSITGTFPPLANQQIRLEGSNGIQTYVIDSTLVNKEGQFILNYSPVDYGMGYMVPQDRKPFVVVLSGEDIITICCLSSNK